MVGDGAKGWFGTKYVGFLVVCFLYHSSPNPRQIRILLKKDVRKK